MTYITKAKRLLFLMVYGSWTILRVLAMWLGGLLLIVGTVAVVDAFTPPNLPEPRRCLSREIRPPRPSREQLEAMSEEERYESIRPALAVLDRVCPEISAWTRGRWEAGRFRLLSKDDRFYATYYPISRVLSLHLLGLEQPDEYIACTLAHEFRHSRQAYLPRVQAVIAALAGMDRKFELVESEAYRFEDRVANAILGRSGK